MLWQTDNALLAAKVEGLNWCVGVGVDAGERTERGAYDTAVHHKLTEIFH